METKAIFVVINSMTWTKLNTNSVNYKKSKQNDERCATLVAIKRC